MTVDDAGGSAAERTAQLAPVPAEPSATESSVGDLAPATDLAPAAEPAPATDSTPATELPPVVALESHESWLPSEHPLYRPRHGRRQLTAIVCAVVFFAAPVLALGVGGSPGEVENRRLAAFPSPLDGWSFFPGLSTWATDHLPLRDRAVDAADAVSRGVFGEPPPSDGRGGAPAQAVPFVPPAPAADPEPTGLQEQAVSAGFAQVIEGRDGWLYYGIDVQSKCKPYRPLDDVLGDLVRLRAAVEASGRSFVLVVPPDKTTAVPRFLPDEYAGEDCAAATGDEFWRRVTAEAGALDLRADLAEVARQDGEPPYHRLDTHWTDRGSLTMVRRLAETISPGVTRDWRSAPKRTSSYQADLPRLLGRDGDAQVQLYTLAPDGVRDRTRNAAELDQPLSFTATPGPGMVRQQVGMLADSFSLSATRYLPAAFADIDVVHYATVTTDPDSVVRSLVDQDVIVVEVVERNLTSGISAAVDPSFVDRLSSELARNPR